MKLPARVFFAPDAEPGRPPPSISARQRVWWTMSAGQAVFSGWMEIADKAVNDASRRHAEEAALEGLVSQYASTLYRVAYSVLRNSADAEDAVQEAFLRVLRHRDSLGEVRDQRVWLVRIVWNVVLDRKRRMKTRPENGDLEELARVLPAGGLSAEERAAAAQHHAHVLACVEQLPEKERQVLLLSAFEELNSVEIATVLGITESSVRSRPLSRAQPDRRPLEPRKESAMNPTDRNTFARDPNSPSYEETLRLLARITPPPGLEERVQDRLRGRRIRLRTSIFLARYAALRLSLHDSGLDARGGCGGHCDRDRWRQLGRLFALADQPDGASRHESSARSRTGQLLERRSHAHTADPQRSAASPSGSSCAASRQADDGRAAAQQGRLPGDPLQFAARPGGKGAAA